MAQQGLTYNNKPKINKSVQRHEDLRNINYTMNNR